eukprot:CAMPEP_0202971628 /NCGR_PEP_ID=MMETSP1396-20130829/28817_1 /ASSEMBLY_ACC=CAM_ASM_000872 /TAXON_ID= /ORGANISM="Pseudokeronopsis sp., Strain Brazil" /LENGTH=34 /DNA_ID= /DNA_START= /DNA_END= /DNA_ORIENTATION=
MEFKQFKDQQREENKVLQTQHEQIMRYEEKCKKL